LRKQFGFRLKFWDQMMAHPNYDQFWKERNIFSKLAKYSRGRDDGRWLVRR